MAMVASSPVRFSGCGLDNLPAQLIGRPNTLACLAALFPSSLHFASCSLSHASLVAAELVNRRGPAAILCATADAPAAQAQALLQLSADLLSSQQLLVLSMPTVDLMLLPRKAAGQDGLAFLAFLTKLSAVQWMDGLLHSKQVLDLDATVLESMMLDVSTRPQGWYNFDWRLDACVNSAGEVVTGRHAQLPDQASAESAHCMRWVKDQAAHEYLVRIRPGWSILKQCLIQEADKFKLSVCSLGRPVYVQLAVRLLDPQHELIPKSEFPARVISARPDGVSTVPNKSPCIGVGLTHPLKQEFSMRLAPLFAIDDSPDYYDSSCSGGGDHRDSVYPIEPYKPTKQGSAIDDGTALAAVTDSMRKFWVKCYGSDGNGGSVAALKATAMELLEKMQGLPFEDPSFLLFYEFVCDRQGRTSWETGFSVAEFLVEQAAQCTVAEQSVGAAAGTASPPSPEVQSEAQSENCPPSSAKEAQAPRPAGVPCQPLQPLQANGSGGVAAAASAGAVADKIVDLLAVAEELLLPACGVEVAVSASG